MSYAVNAESAEAARKSEHRTSFIDTKGAYLGVFTKAEDIKAASGTRGVSISFKGNDGAMSNFAIYTVKSDGTQLPDYGLLISIMTVLGVRDIKPQKTRVSEWDRDAKANVEIDAMCFRELMNKQIGCLFIMEEYEKQNTPGEYGWGARLNGVYRAADELVASEILDRKTRPEKLQNLIDTLRDRPVKSKKQAAGGSLGSRRSSGADAPHGDGMEEDLIPF